MKAIIMQHNAPCQVHNMIYYLYCWIIITNVSSILMCGMEKNENTQVSECSLPSTHILLNMLQRLFTDKSAHVLPSAGAKCAALSY